MSAGDSPSPPGFINASHERVEVDVPHESPLVDDVAFSPVESGFSSGSSSRRDPTWSLERSFSLTNQSIPGEDGRLLPSIRNLNTLSGVFSPVALSMFSTVLFLRIGLVVGQSGLYQSLIQFLLAYCILYLTILSVCAISTNGEVEGGGAYFMISRTLGPEFGGSIGFLFFLANITSCALYISGFAGSLEDNFGPNGQLVSGLMEGRWWTYLYATVILLVCLIICLIGGAMFARTSIIILIVAVFCMGTAVLSFFITKAKCIPLTKAYVNSSDPNSTVACAWFTGFNGTTFTDNLPSGYAEDVESGKLMDFAIVFAIVFSSVTGIMNGANMSGELKKPSYAIPVGTLSAATFTLVSYLVLVFMIAATCVRELLLNNYSVFLQQINVWSPFVVIGIFATTLSAALGNLIGASRVLEALAKDQLFWNFLRPATVTSRSGNPYIAVIISWGLVQIVLLIGSLNAIAPLASVFFLLAYAATNIACLGLDLTSAPNFRPTFRYFSWHTSGLGVLGCMIMCFLINPYYASAAVITLMALVIVLHFRTWPASWGSISQALIFHQVRKYLLMLDIRKAHIRFWRPQILLLVNNPRTSSNLIEFVNDIKKSGLLVLGHVKIGDFDGQAFDPLLDDNLLWLHLVDTLKVKAFVEITLAKTVREGMHHLGRLSGLGGMKPNTICFGFYDNQVPLDALAKKIQKRKKVRFAAGEDTVSSDFHTNFPDIRTLGYDKELNPTEYVKMIGDCVKMKKSICLFRHFQNVDKDAVIQSKTPFYIDVWPLNFFQPDTANYYDNTQQYMLQLACVLHMVSGWKGNTILRVFLPIETHADDARKKERKLNQLLKQLRIIAQVKIVCWEHVTQRLERSGVESDSMLMDEMERRRECPTDISDTFLNGVNELVAVHSGSTAVTFFYLPVPPRDVSNYDRYLYQLDTISHGLPPTVFVHGQHPVTSTTL